MPTLELICEYCGHRFTQSADYFIPGISGFIGGKTFIDPAKTHRCPECAEKIYNDCLQFVMKEATPEEKRIDCMKGMVE